MLPGVVAIIGRPNVGKSALFNRLVGRRKAITSSLAGTTRDGVTGEVSWGGKCFSLIDTGGLCDFSSAEAFYYPFVESCVRSALRSAQLVLFVVDVKEGLTHVDAEVALFLKKSQKPVLICANKCDAVGNFEAGIYEFCSLGFGVPVAVSAVHGHGTGDLLDKVCLHIDSGRELGGLNDVTINVAVVGKPNAGKSSIVNRVTSSERCTVTEIPGTTRDSVDVLFRNEVGSYNFIDTAGIRKQKKVSDEVERYSVIRSKEAIESSDVCLIVVDAVCGLTEQDLKILGYVETAGKGCIIVVNKWDLLEKDTNTMKIYERALLNQINFAKYVPVVFVSAKTGKRINDIFHLINMVHSSHRLRIATGSLNAFLCKITSKVPTPTHKGKKLKIYYVTQASVAPPVFVFFVNNSKLFHFSYRRYIENCLRDYFELKGTPVRFVVREKTSFKETVRI